MNDISYNYTKPLIMTTVEIHSSLNSLETNTLARIEECYNIFFSNVKETISSLIELSISHTSFIANVVKNEVSQVRLVIDDFEAKNTEMKVEINKFFTCNPVVKHYAQTEQKIQVQKNECSRIFVRKNSKTNNKRPCSNSKEYTIRKKNENMDPVMNALLLPQQERVKIKVITNSSGTDQVYECGGCNFKSSEDWAINKHLEEEHNSRPAFIMNNKCPKCSYTVNSPYLLNKHVIGDVHIGVRREPKKHRCFKCLKIYNHWNLLKEHQLSLVDCSSVVDDYII